MKETVVLITGIYQLLQAIWYIQSHPDSNYTALIKKADLGQSVKDRLVECCKRSRLFKETIVAQGTNMDSSAVKKAKLFLSMFGYFIVGKRSKLTQRIIEENIGARRFDKAIVDSDYSIIGGAFIDQSEKMRVIIMQDGFSDYAKRRTVPKPTLRDMLGYVTARMGYVNFCEFYLLPKLAHCEKFLSFPELHRYHSYKEIIPLFDMTQEENERFLKTAHETFIDKEIPDLSNADIILITSPICIFPEYKQCYDQIHEWLRKNAAGKRIYLKQHPKDSYQYDWPEFNFTYLDTIIPAELLLSNLKPNQMVVYMLLSTCYLSMPKDVPYKVFFFDVLPDRYTGKIQEIFKIMNIEDDHIIRQSRETR